MEQMDNILEKWRVVVPWYSSRLYEEGGSAKKGEHVVEKG